VYPGADGSLIVDFFRPADARRYEKKVARKSEQRIAEPAKSCEGPGSLQENPLPPSLEQIPTPFKSKKAPVTSSAKTEPKKEVSQKICQKKAQPAAAQAPQIQPMASSSRVAIDGLPARLLTKPMMLAMLENVVSKEDIVNIDVTAGKSRAVVDVNSPLAASKLVEHCHGCKWNNNGPPIRAWLHNVVIQECFKEAPAYVHLGAKDRKFATNSDASTNVSDSELEEHERSGRVMTPWQCYP
jgi:hypothetical protein